MFREFYYWTTKYLSLIKSNKTPSFNAYLIVCILQGLNIETVLVWLNYFLKINIAKDTAVFFGLVLAFLMAFLNYFLLYKKKESILNELTTKQNINNTLRQVYYWIYVLFTFIIFFVSVANLVEPKY